ncbi:uncharacterized protein LOC111097286 [Canis lupus familiaris]|uniref:uncharacterized protein LOC111097286 n=1 Tax=Canis lupus familiaris TaxID=9615 RepID=UPI0018F7D9AB|nr:uncharacterized protein LOC111097286 [Canis lupus familiaris]
MDGVMDVVVTTGPPTTSTCLAPEVKADRVDGETPSPRGQQLGAEGRAPCRGLRTRGKSRPGHPPKQPPRKDLHGVPPGCADEEVGTQRLRWLQGRTAIWTQVCIPKSLCSDRYTTLSPTLLPPVANHGPAHPIQPLELEGGHLCVLSPYTAPAAVLEAGCAAGKKLEGPAFRELVFQKDAQLPTARDRQTLAVPMAASHCPPGDRMVGGRSQDARLLFQEERRARKREPQGAGEEAEPSRRQAG